MPEPIVVAPSATPGTVPPASVPAPQTAAPSAPAANPLATPADFDRYAALAITANLTPPPEPAAAPAVPPGPESPPVEQQVAVSESPAPAATVPADEDPEPSAEVLASLNDAGKRALQAEREARKEARAKVKELEAKVAELQAKNTPPADATIATPPNPPAADPAAAPTDTPSVPGALANCRTFDQVDASTMQAVRDKSLATKLILKMSAGDKPAVLEALKAQKVANIDGTPLDDATDAQISELLVNVQTGCEVTLQQAPLRKAELAREANSFIEAGKILPGLNDPKSAAWKAFATYVQQNPTVRNLGPAWPQMVAEGVAHRLSRSSPGTVTATTPPPAAAPAPVPPTPRSAPGAPRTSVAALPKKSEREEIVERLNNGTATTKDMDRYASLSLSGA